MTMIENLNTEILQPGDIIFQYVQPEKYGSNVDKLITLFQKFGSVFNPNSEVSDAKARLTVHVMMYTGCNTTSVENNDKSLYFLDARGEPGVGIRSVYDLAKHIGDKDHKDTYGFSVYRSASSSEPSEITAAINLGLKLASLHLEYNKTNVVFSQIRLKSYDKYAQERTHKLANKLISNVGVISQVKGSTIDESFFCSGLIIAIWQLAIISSERARAKAKHENSENKTIKERLDLDFQTTQPATLHQYIINKSIEKQDWVRIL